MTIERFIEKFKFPAVKCIGNIPNKILAKVLKRYRHIDVREYWFDDPDDPDKFVWEDIEGIGYGWLWLGFRKYGKELKMLKLKRRLVNWALGFHRNEPLWFCEECGERHYLFSLDKEIVEITASNNEIDCW